MYIEEWQIWTLGFLVVAAYFSYKSGWKEGFRQGMNYVIFDLHARHLISKKEDEETGELMVGRYGEEPKEHPENEREDY